MWGGGFTHCDSRLNQSNFTPHPTKPATGHIIQYLASLNGRSELVPRLHIYKHVQFSVSRGSPAHVHNGIYSVPGGVACAVSQLGVTGL